MKFSGKISLAGHIRRKLSPLQVSHYTVSLCTGPLPIHSDSVLYIAMWLSYFALFRQFWSALDEQRPGWEATLGHKLVVPGMMGILSAGVPVCSSVSILAVNLIIIMAFLQEQ